MLYIFHVSHMIQNIHLLMQSKIIEFDLRISVSVKKSPPSEQEHKFRQTYELSPLIAYKARILKDSSIRFGLHFKVIKNKFIGSVKHLHARYFFCVVLGQ